MTITVQQGLYFLEPFLRYNLPIFYARRSRDLVWSDGALLPQVGDLPWGAQEVAVELIDWKGEAQIVASEDGDVPFSDIRISRDIFRVVTIASALRYKLSEIEAAQFAQQNGQIVTNIVEQKTLAAKRVMDELSNKLAAFGNAGYGIQGILNNPSVPVVTSSFKPYASASTPQQLVDWVLDQWATIITNTQLVEQPNRLVVTFHLYNILLQTILSTTTGITVLEQILRVGALLGLEKITYVNELQTDELIAAGVYSSGTTTERMLVYKLDPTYSFFRRISSYKTSEPEYRKEGFDIYMRQKVSSVYNPFPESSSYIDYANAA